MTGQEHPVVQHAGSGILDFICSWCQEALGCPASPDDSLFGLGGDSLSAIELAEALGERTGSEVPIQQVFDMASLGELAARVERLAERGA